MTIKESTHNPKKTCKQYNRQVTPINLSGTQPSSFTLQKYEKCATIMGINYPKEPAQRQFEKMDANGQKILNTALIADIEYIECSANGEPKFSKKKNSRQIRVAYDTKLKKYTHNDSNIVPASETIRQELDNAFIH